MTTAGRRIREGLEKPRDEKEALAERVKASVVAESDRLELELPMGGVNGMIDCNIDPRQDQLFTHCQKVHKGMFSRK